MTDEQIAAVARGLSDAQRAWLLREQDRPHFDPSFASLELEDLRLAKPVFCHLEGDFGHVANQHGLAVRRYLQEQG